MILNIIPKPNKVELLPGMADISTLPREYEQNEYYPDEYYRIEIKDGKILIASKGEQGRFYAEQTLKQMAVMGKVPNCIITDLPEFPYRGFMIDSARHMQTVDEIKKYIEAAALFKFNVFHWHLCDDQGFRIESEKYPLLNEKGSWRSCHGFGSKNMEKYGGYYTKEEIRDVINFCKERFIEVIPEIDMPGHTTALVSSYPELSCRGVEIPLETTGGIFKNIICAGKQEVYEFCYGLLDEVMELFPSDYIHIGGDEAPKARWCNCESCQKVIRQQGLKNEEELQGYFVNRIIAYLRKKGKRALCWNESLNSGLLDNSAIICDWMDRKHLSEAFANGGGKIIIEEFYHYYLDYPYGMTPLKKTYSYNPYLEKLDFTGRQNVIGVETPIWTEYVEDFDRLCYMCFPRMIAVGERGWTSPKNADYESFKKRVKNCKVLLDEIGIKMADSTEWDPDITVRISDNLDRLKTILSPESVKTFLFPNKDD